MDILLAQQSVENSTSIIGALPPLILMFLIFYFIVIRPQSKERKQLENELNSLAKGDRVLSSGGIIGKIIEFQGKDDDILIVDTEYNGKLKIKKSFILKKIISSKDNS